MTPDRQKIKVLVAALAVLVLTLYLVNQINQPPAASAVQPVMGRDGSMVVRGAAVEARIHLDRLGSGLVSAEPGRKNLFQYEPIQPPRPVATPRPQQELPAGPGPAGPTVVLPPPPPPPIPLRFSGYAVIDAARNTRAAFLGDDRTNFTVVEGEVLMGRYRVLKITNDTVEVEDLEYNRKQTLPLVK